MPSPFPGLDPFLEDQGYWNEFRKVFIGWTQYSLAERIPDSYEVRLGERMSLISPPDSHPEYGSRSDTGEVSELRIEIRRLSDRAVITVIELLSPINKQAQGANLYSKDRFEILQRRVHLVELDLLIDGERLNMQDELPRGHYYAFVSRAKRRPASDVYAWSIRDPLPTIPIPLMTPDPDISLDLAAIFQTVYQRARYERSINYKAPLGLPLRREDRDWAEAIAQNFDPRAVR
jgi:hypothetical protein